MCIRDSYYNPWPEEKSVTVEAAGKGRVHDLTHNRWLEAQGGKLQLKLDPRQALVIEFQGCSTRVATMEVALGAPATA